MFRSKFLPILILSLCLPALIFSAERETRSYDWPKMFEYARVLLTRKPVQKFLKEAFKQGLQISEADAQKVGFQAEALKEISEPQFLLLLRENPEHWPLIDKYIEDFTPVDDAHQRIRKRLKSKWKKEFDGFLKEHQMYSAFKKWNIFRHPMLDGDASDKPSGRDVLLYALSNRSLDGEEDMPEKLKTFLEGLHEDPEFLKMVDNYVLDANPGYEEYLAALKVISKEWRPVFLKLMEKEHVLKEFLKYNDPLEPFVLDRADGKPSYDDADLRLIFTHERPKNGKLVPPANFIEEVIKFIDGAEKEVAWNVFDFDLMEIAEAFARAHKSGKIVRGGIDDKVVEEREKVKAVYDFLVEQGVPTTLVDSPGLNHQKVIVRDWSDPKKAKLLFLSSNFTQSGMHPEGDLAGIKNRPDYSIPNANNAIFIPSYELAQLVNHELTKTLDMQLRGKSEYPLSGAYKVLAKGPGKKNSNYTVVAFTPSGALDNINQNLISRVIIKGDGPPRLAQFAFSSDIVADALFERAKADLKKGKKVDIMIVGDTPFALMDWSVSLQISGLGVERSVDEDGKKTKTYFELKENRWLDLLGKKAYDELKKQIRVAPKIYGMRSFKLSDGTSVSVTGKIHHKLVSVGRFSTAGTSLNLSKGALGNNEQVVLTSSKRIGSEVREAIEYLVVGSAESRPKTGGSVFAEAMKRLRWSLKGLRDWGTKSRLGKCLKALEQTGKELGN